MLLIVFWILTDSGRPLVQNSIGHRSEHCTILCQGRHRTGPGDTLDNPFAKGLWPGHGIAETLPLLQPLAGTYPDVDMLFSMGAQEI